MKDMSEHIEISIKNWEKCKLHIPQSDLDYAWSLLCDYVHYSSWSETAMTQGFDARMELSKYLESIGITNYQICY